MMLSPDHGHSVPRDVLAAQLLEWYQGADPGKRAETAPPLIERSQKA